MSTLNSVNEDGASSCSASQLRPAFPDRDMTVLRCILMYVPNAFVSAPSALRSFFCRDRHMKKAIALIRMKAPPAPTPTPTPIMAPEDMPESPEPLEPPESPALAELVGGLLGDEIDVASCFFRVELGVLFELEFEELVDETNSASDLLKLAGSRRFVRGLNVSVVSSTAQP